MVKRLTTTKTDKKVEGYNNMNHLYLSIPVDCEELAKIKVTVESHDQGWTNSHDPRSWSWGEIGILDSEGKEKGPRIEVYRNNVADKEWQMHEKVITENDFLSNIKKGDKVAVWLRSQYPGWSNHAKSGEIELFEKGSENEEWVREVINFEEEWIENQENLLPRFTWCSLCTQISNWWQERKKGKAQGWLDQKYPKEKRNEITEIYLNEPDLSGELDLSDFTYRSHRGSGTKVYISVQVDESKIRIKNQGKNVKVINLVSAQEWLDQNYPKEERKNINSLEINGKSLEGSLNLSDFINLEKLYCGNNKLTSLQITNCSYLKMIDCRNNKFTNLELSNLSQLQELECSYNELTNLKVNGDTNLEYLCFNDNHFTDLNSLLDVCQPQKLKKLELSKNDFSVSCLTPFSKFVNLENLDVSDNRFTGSLSPLQNCSKLWWLDISDTDIDSGLEYLPESLENFSCFTNQESTKQVKKIAEQLTPYQNHKEDREGIKNWREWKKNRFSEEEFKRWVESGAKLEDYKFISWLRDVKKVSAEWVLNNKDSNKYKEIREKINKCGWCRQCQRINTNDNWCQTCAEKKWQEDIKQLTGKEVIEKFIQQQPVNKWSKRERKKFEWIPYEQFTDIEKIGEGGFSKVYKAKWKKEQNVNNDMVVVLKNLNNSQIITLEFLTEIANNVLLDGSRIASCYGISQDPITKNYILVTQYIKEGNLRQFLQNKQYYKNKGSAFDINRLKCKLDKLALIAFGLKDIHCQELVHCDLHFGNILNDSDWQCYITDLGLSRPANCQKEEGRIFGILPYIAPEVLKGDTYTQTSDIYSFGMVAYELLSNTYPYRDMPHDKFLAAKICQGLRPNLEEVKIPQECKNLIKSCWDADPKKRPGAWELITKIADIETSITHQIEEDYNTFSQTTSYQNPSTSITSKMIDTKQVAELVKNLQKSEQIPSNATEAVKQIEEIENKLEELKKSLDNELIALVDQFTKAKKQSLKDKENKELEDQVWELEGELEAKGLTTKMDEIIRYCEELVELDKQLEKEQLETKIEVIPK